MNSNLPPAANVTAALSPATVQTSAFAPTFKFSPTKAALFPLMVNVPAASPPAQVPPDSSIRVMMAAAALVAPVIVSPTCGSYVPPEVNEIVAPRSTSAHPEAVPLYMTQALLAALLRKA